MPMLHSSINVFQRLAHRSKDSRFSCLLSVGPTIYATDGVVALRSSAFTLPGVVSGTPAVDALAHVFDDVSSRDLHFAASAPKADYHGGRPIISEKLHAYVRFAKNQGEKAAFYPVGDCMVDASLLADVLTAIPDACIYAVPGDPYKPLFFRGAYAEGILLPVRLNMQRIGHCLQLLDDYQRESGEQGANPSRPFLTIPLDKIAEEAAEETKRQQEAQRQLEQERESYIRQRQAEEAAQREQAEKERAEKRESTRKALLSEGENMPVDGASICELAAEIGVSIPLRTKGFILQKLATISIADGQFRHYTFRAKKGAQGSDACFKYIQALIDALKMQVFESEAENSEDSSENNVVEPKNQASNLENTAAKESYGPSAADDPAAPTSPENSEEHPLQTPTDLVGDSNHSDAPAISSDPQAAASPLAQAGPDDMGAHSDHQPPIFPEDVSPAKAKTRRRKKPKPAKQSAAEFRSQSDKAILQTFVESDLSRFGAVTEQTQNALRYQGYFWDGHRLHECKKAPHLLAYSSG